MDWLDRFEAVTTILVIIGAIIFPFAGFAVLWFSAAGARSEMFAAWGALSIAFALLLLPLLLQLLVYLWVLVSGLFRDGERNERKLARCGHARREEWQRAMEEARDARGF